MKKSRGFLKPLAWCSTTVFTGFKTRANFSSNPKPIATRSQTFSSAWRQLHEITSSFDWLTIYSMSFLIGWEEYLVFKIETWANAKSITFRPSNVHAFKIRTSRSNCFVTATRLSRRKQVILFTFVLFIKNSCFVFKRTRLVPSDYIRYTREEFFRQLKTLKTKGVIGDTSQK